MNNEIIHSIGEVFFIFFSFGIVSSYLTLVFVSFFSVKKYMKKDRLTNYKDLLGSEMAPSISLIAPAYNEGMTIVENIKSMLSLEYNNYDVIVVNDGSKDDTLPKVIKAYDLEEVPFYVNGKVKTASIRGIYKSRNKAFRKLTFIDKKNGGKADALNAGINVSSSRLVTCIDVDCIIENDALQRMVKPFMEDAETIASGGVVRIANSCVVEHGKLVKVNLPTNRLARFQVLEYLRAFLMSRMAWAKMNGLLLISGAFGMFDRKLVLRAGGYNTDTVGEDMELVVRMRSLLDKENKKYKVNLIPDPLCWTEGPTTNKVLGKQRNRWARGTFEVLKEHRKVFLNPKYKVMGILSYPFWLFFEWLAPFVEGFGLIYTFSHLFFGTISWKYFLGFTILVYFFSLFISTFTLYTEEISFHKYKGVKSQLKLFLAAVLEPFIFHPRNTWWSLKGHWDLLKGIKSWGEMTREGFAQNTKSVPTYQPQS
ncbi:MAG: glycosyltransferase [Bacteroidota bacterium]